MCCLERCLLLLLVKVALGVAGDLLELLSGLCSRSPAGDSACVPATVIGRVPGKCLPLAACVSGTCPVRGTCSCHQVAADLSC